MQKGDTWTNINTPTVFRLSANAIIFYLNELEETSAALTVSERLFLSAALCKALAVFAKMPERRKYAR